MASSPTSCLSWFPPWATSVVQAGQYNAAVFHAVTALSTMLQCTDDAHGVVGSPTSLGMQMADAKQQFAVDQYCKSMNLMRDLIGKISNGKYTESQAETCVRPPLYPLPRCMLTLLDAADDVPLVSFDRDTPAHRQRHGALQDSPPHHTQLPPRILVAT